MTEVIREGIDRDIEFALTAAYIAGKTGEPKGVTIDKCRIYLKKALHSQDVVIKVKGELPKVYDDEHPDGFGLPSWCTEAYKKAGYEATISLIERDRTPLV